MRWKIMSDSDTKTNDLFVQPTLKKCIVKVNTSDKWNYTLQWSKHENEIFQYNE